MLKNILVGQSGGPTAVINSSLYGVIEEGLRNKEKIGTVYGMELRDFWQAISLIFLKWQIMSRLID